MICAVLAIALLIVVIPGRQDSAPIIDTPTHDDAFATQNIEINVVVTDDGEVATVVLSYSDDSKATWHNVTMTGTGTTVWTGSGQIPPQDIETTIYYKIYAKDNKNQWTVNDNNSQCFQLITGNRKAFIVCSANDFQGSEVEDEFNGGYDSNFSLDTGNWKFQLVANAIGGINPITGMANSTQLIDGIPQESYFIYNWTNVYPLVEYAMYNMSVLIIIDNYMIGLGVRIGLRWLDSEATVVRTDWSPYVINPIQELQVAGVCNNATGNEITQLELVLECNLQHLAPNNAVFFDDVKMSHTLIANLTHPFDPGTPPPARNKNCDGFPAQALQVYWTLRDHGYSDENIFLMLYYKDDADGVIDIAQGGSTNDLIGAMIDVENESVTANRVKQELNVSYTGSFASGIEPNDQLIIYMTDHGANAVLPDRNATFHFEADASFITEFEFYDLVSQIDCWRMMINIDCCFSGNFLNTNSSIGSAWYNLTNCIFVSAAANMLSWYWVDNVNADGFAGSWFFHIFWDQLDQNQTIDTAFNNALNFIPAGQAAPLALIQVPLIQDNLGISTTWNFTSFSKL